MGSHSRDGRTSKESTDAVALACTLESNFPLYPATPFQLKPLKLASKMRTEGCTHQDTIPECSCCPSCAQEPKQKESCYVTKVLDFRNLPLLSKVTYDALNLFSNSHTFPQNAQVTIATGFRISGATS